jgi:hypothetical protein
LHGTLAAIAADFGGRLPRKDAGACGNRGEYRGAVAAGQSPGRASGKIWPAMIISTSASSLDSGSSSAS